MAGQKTDDLELIFVVITVGMILLSLAIIASVFLYQQKLQNRKNQLKNLEIDHQKDLLNSSIEARELEQRRIAFELHDDVGSTLSAIKFSLASSKMEDSVKEQLNGNLVNAIQKVRRISQELLPSILDELGIVPASTSLIKSLNDQINHIDFSIQTEKNPSAPEQTKEIDLAIYRVLQELLNNIIKYAEASAVQVNLIQNENGLQLTIEDNGNGFDPQTIDKNVPTLGLRNIEMRIQQIKGRIVYLKINKGTRVEVKWEVKEK